MVNTVGTLLGLRLIDPLGRRTLLFCGGVGYILSLGGCSWAFASDSMGMVPAFIFAFVGAHCVGQGVVIWVFISCVLPPPSSCPAVC